ncbi:hypothetical protein EXIGLDRAFT_725229 [Exidia glandulosa HHB12029]|uniref:Uncharacterized protein n=1 Tax=Exidia glandulosa HHB12029 TaxID=1314781 RepID=A0A165E4B3_EXIGL|nr:hypothetical protein EXIGLDRAFT_725229 [Exidia glandulosa HHB12029]
MLLQQRPENILDLDALKRPSIYTNLDTLEWDEARLAALPPIVNFPMVMAPVSRSEKKKIWPDDTHAWMTHEGTVSPDKRLVFVTHDVSPPTRREGEY